MIEFNPKGVCSRQMRVELDEGNTIRRVEVVGGCNGNLQGIASLLHGVQAETAIERLKGIRCGAKPTSCPDQLAQGLERALRGEA